jgi:single-strand DNA-binding protein
MNLNKVFLIGNLTRDPEARALPSGQAVSSFGLATNRMWTDSQTKEKKKQAEFHNIVAFGKLAEICNQYLNKGKLVYVEGRLQTRSWDDQEGNKKYRTEIVADGMQMGPRLDKGPNDKGTETKEAVPEIQVDEDTKDKKSSTKKEEEEKGEEKEEEIDVKDIPF